MKNNNNSPKFKIGDIVKCNQFNINSTINNHWCTFKVEVIAEGCDGEFYYYSSGISANEGSLKLYEE